MAKKKPKASWEVAMTCTVMKIVICENCTEQQARESPFEHAVDELETGQIDWEVDSVKQIQ